MAGARSRQLRKDFICTIMTHIFHNTQISINEAEKSCFLNQFRLSRQFKKLISAKNILKDQDHIVRKLGTFRYQDV